ncbi:MAG: CDP-glycerol glycerophosphotransferase family protein [Patescibacteria group bacterium]
MNLDFFAREIHHQKHAQAIADGFGLTVKSKAEDITADYVCVFAYGDLKLMDKLGKKIIFCEHGVGMYYNNEHPSYAGSKEHRENVVLRLSPNKMHSDKEKETLNCPIEIIGVPKLDKYADKKYRVIRKYRPTIAISFHWDCLVCQETRSSFKYFEKVLPLLKKNFEIIGHGHPRIIDKIAPYYKKYGIKFTRDFETVLSKADVYICDNSSTIYEWGITRKPIVLLNPPFYRREIEHKGNPRFWKHSDIAPLCDKPEDLERCIWDAVKNHEYYLPKIEMANRHILSFTDGKCTERAVNAIKKNIQNEN